MEVYPLHYQDVINALSKSFNVKLVETTRHKEITYYVEFKNQVTLSENTGFPINAFAGGILDMPFSLTALPDKDGNRVGKNVLGTRAMLIRISSDCYEIPLKNYPKALYDLLRKYESQGSSYALHTHSGETRHSSGNTKTALSLVVRTCC
jgi:hypothetical protein